MNFFNIKLETIYQWICTNEQVKEMNINDQLKVLEMSFNDWIKGNEFTKNELTNMGYIFEGDNKLILHSIYQGVTFELSGTYEVDQEKCKLQSFTIENSKQLMSNNKKISKCTNNEKKVETNSEKEIHTNFASVPKCLVEIIIYLISKKNTLLNKPKCMIYEYNQYCNLKEEQKQYPLIYHHNNTYEVIHDPYVDGDCFLSDFCAVCYSLFGKNDMISDKIRELDSLENCNRLVKELFTTLIQKENDCYLNEIIKILNIEWLTRKGEKKDVGRRSFTKLK